MGSSLPTGRPRRLLLGTTAGAAAAAPATAPLCACVRLSVCLHIRQVCQKRQALCLHRYITPHQHHSADDNSHSIR